MPTGSLGPRAQATVGYLTGRIGASQRDVQELLAEKEEERKRAAAMLMAFLKSADAEPKDESKDQQ